MKNQPICGDQRPHEPHRFGADWCAGEEVYRVHAELDLAGYRAGYHAGRRELLEEMLQEFFPEDM